MQIISMKIEDVHPYENNPRINDEAARYVANSIKEFGWKQPLVIDKNGVIIVGHTRYKAAKLLGMTEVPCVVADNLSEEEIHEYRIADNKTAEKATWNLVGLSGEIDETGGDYTNYGFYNDELDMLARFGQTISENIPEFGDLDFSTPIRPTITPSVKDDDVAEMPTEETETKEEKLFQKPYVTCPYCGCEIDAEDYE